MSKATREPEGHHATVEPTEVLRAEPQVIHLVDFPCEGGPILDLGGGGEGIIGLVKGERVVAIDTVREELASAPGEALKLVMDAREMSFLDASFRTATAFFTLMYIARPDLEKVLREVHRVLRSGGRLLIWDASMPAPSGGKRVFLLPLTVTLPGGLEVRTGYGVRLRKHNLALVRALAEGVGFETLDASESGDVFFLDLRKPRDG